MENKLIFNKRIYTFNNQILKKIYEYLVYNDRLGENDEFYALSFLSNSFVKKRWDDLDYHEFMLIGSYCVSNLLCNIDNIFGQDKAVLFAKGISSLQKKYGINFTESIYTTENFISISTSDATEIGNAVFTSSDDMEKFKCFLSLLNLYNCAKEDYEQQIRDIDEFKNIIFVNGLGAIKYVSDEKLILKPIHKIYDTPLRDYADFSGILVSPSIIAATLYAEHKCSIVKTCTIQQNIFFLKYEQLTGMKLEKPSPKIDYTSWALDSSIFGKWYRLYKTEEPFVTFYLTIHWYKEDGSFKNSIVIGSTTDFSYYENCNPKTSLWRTHEGYIATDIGSDLEKCAKYEVSNNKLTISNKDYYRTYEEALKALDNIRLS